MSPLEQYRALARYNRWMNRKLYAAVAALDAQEQKRDRGAFFGSISGTLNHILLADRAWLGRFTSDPERFGSRDLAGQPIVITSLAQILYDEFRELERERERTDEDLLAWTYSLDEQALDSMLEYKTSRGEMKRQVLWWAVGHLFNHQTHHRGQVTTLLTQAGIDPGATDLVAMLNEEASAR